ncbi:hypothetical protein EUTSA_v10009984mg [Eutrema salsugineum]|uniref:TF-B3 domain-containing protein n=1 Tax=Eutrema salsugineum TaxID=72664 RepID=V4MVV5_EUTSA|nr:hypothetical protein EUTSA_v10009984mg [Eutrema salsugineum]
MIDDEEAARILLMLSGSLPPSTMKQSVVDAREREERVFVRVPRRRRSLRVHIATITYSSSSSTPTVEYVSKEDSDGISNGPPMESPAKPTKNLKKRPPLFPTMKKQAKKAKRGTDCAEASSSGTREPTPEWLLELMSTMNGKDPKKIIEKELTKTDMSPGHNRLSMPFSKIVDLEFLNPEELKIIQEDAYRDHMVGVDANLVSSDGWVFDVNVRRWNMDKKSGSSSHIYNLVTGWKTVVSFCGLKENDTIRVWSFRSGDDELYFALVPPTSDSGESKSEEMCSSSVTCEKSHDDLPPN